MTAHDRTASDERPPDSDEDLIATDADDTGRTAFVPSDNTTLTSIVDGLAEKGFGGSLTPLPGGDMQCSNCDAFSPAGEFTVETLRRLEGASDPDEMLAVVAAICPRCGQGGVAVLGYGPIASEADADVMALLQPPPPPSGS